VQAFPFIIRLPLILQESPMTKLKSLLSAAAIAVSLMVAHPAQAEAPPPPATAGPGACPALWKVSDEDTTIWLFGTVHILPDGVTWYGGPVQTAFEAADSLVTEIVEPPADTMQALVMKKAAREDGQTLRASLSASEAARYEAAMTSVGLPVAALDPVDAWFAAVTLGTLPILKAGYSPENGVDKQIIAKANAKKIPHTGLETAEFQLGLFDSLTPDVQRAYLGEVMDQLPTVKEQLEGMVEAWKKGDAETLARLMNEDESAPQLMEVLLINRNRTWATWIKQRLAQPGDVFIAVGAGHLAGAGSVQDQLAAAGIASTRVQ